MIIGISGKIGAGKDTVGKIIQYFTSGLDKGNVAYDVWDGNTLWNTKPHNWQIRKFADALKDIVCILTGCTRKQLEDIDFKNSKLHDEWIRYFYTSISGDKSKLYNTYDDAFKDCPKQFHLVQNEHFTYRELLQYLGTDLLRNQLHENVWVNALMSEYKGTTYTDISSDCPRQGVYDVTETDEVIYGSIKTDYPNWIITDVRFPNEAKAIKDKGGIIIRVIKDEPCEICGLTLAEKRGNICKEISCPLGRKQHKSETALDNATFDYTVSAKQGDIKSLIQQTKEILIKEKLLCLNENKN